MRTIVGFFVKPEDAENAVKALKEAGFSGDGIALLARDPHVDASLGEPPRPARGAGQGAVAGGVLGGLIGLLGAVASFTVPGLGPVVATGFAATALSAVAQGAGVGALAGGVVGAVRGMDVHGVDPNVCAEAVKRCALMIGVRAEEGQAEIAGEIMRNAGAIDINESVEEWNAAGWRGRYDESTLPGRDYPRIKDADWLFW